MTKEEYQEHVKFCWQLAVMANAVPTGNMLERIERADSIGAILDPTLYRANHKAMMEDKAVIAAVNLLAQLSPLKARAATEA